ncbi:MAG: hypothetical protein EBU23_06465 [Mycobacteriaceae bacterium]|nr:hypothetical protein [Mycobacteriaceae bacterium]
MEDHAGLIQFADDCGRALLRLFFGGAQSRVNEPLKDLFALLAVLNQLNVVDYPLLAALLRGAGLTFRAGAR